MAERERPLFTLSDLLCLTMLLFFGCISWAVVTAPTGMDAKKSKAQLGCTSIATAIEGYIENEANAKHEFPTALHDLLKPPFGGPSLLRNGEADLIDPWGKPYEWERGRRADGTEFVLVKTAAPDGTPISQYGIGEKNYRPRD